MKQHSELKNEIESCKTGKGACAFWWLGQQGFALKLGRTILYLDPYVSPHPDRLTAPLLDPEEMTDACLVIGSHDHGDHIDRPAWQRLAAVSDRVRFVVPDALLPGLAKELSIPFERFIGLDDGQNFSINDISVTGVAAAHEFLDQDPISGRYPYLGCIIEGNGMSVYHAGDTCRYEGLVRRLTQCRIDVCFLPINGRDAKRYATGCIGNMTYQEAADLAGEIQARVCVPAHYDMFAMNSENPQLLVDYMAVKYPETGVCVCKHGERVIVRMDLKTSWS